MVADTRHASITKCHNCIYSKKGKTSENIESETIKSEKSGYVKSVKTELFGRTELSNVAKTGGDKLSAYSWGY